MNFRLCVLRMSAYEKMRALSPSTRLLVVLHVGSLSGTVRHQQRWTNDGYELFGSALDVCRQIVSAMPTTSVSKQFTIVITKDALDNEDHSGCEGSSDDMESPTLVRSSSFSVVSGPHILYAVKTAMA